METAFPAAMTAAGMYGQKPGQPVWPLLLKDSLEAFYQMEVELINTSVGGMASDWALEHVQENVCDYRPDLVLLGFGMNDRCPGKEYAQKTESLLMLFGQAVRRQR